MMLMVILLQKSLQSLRSNFFWGGIDIGGNNDNQEANEHMEPTTKVVPDVDVEPKEGELNKDVVVKVNSAKGIIVVEVASKEIDEVDSIIRSVISSID